MLSTTVLADRLPRQIAKFAIYLCFIGLFANAPSYAEKPKLAIFGLQSSDMVVLSGEPCFPPDPPTQANKFCHKFTTRMLPDGTQQTAFSVPDGKVLVVTEINWVWNGGGGPLNNLICLALQIAEITPGDPGFSVMHQSCTQLDQIAKGARSETFDTGFLVHHNENFYIADIFAPGAGTLPDGGSFSGPVIVRGYLADLSE